MSSDGGARVIWDSDDVNRALKRIAHQVLESNRGAEGLVLLGIRTRGIPLARRSPLRWSAKAQARAWRRCAAPSTR